MNSISNCGFYSNEENIASALTAVTFLQLYEECAVFKHFVVHHTRHCCTPPKQSGVWFAGL